MWWKIVLLVLGFYLILGPVMLFFAWLNKVDPYILEKIDSSQIDLGTLGSREKKSLMVVTILRPLFSPLWVETKVIRKIKEYVNKKKN